MFNTDTHTTSALALVASIGCFLFLRHLYCYYCFHFVRTTSHTIKQQKKRKEGEPNEYEVNILYRKEGINTTTKKRELGYPLSKRAPSKKHLKTKREPCFLFVLFVSLLKGETAKFFFLSKGGNSSRRSDASSLVLYFFSSFFPKSLVLVVL